MQASNADQNTSSESSHTCDVNSPLEVCHGFYFKIPCPLCRSAAASYSAVQSGEQKIMGPVPGLSDFKFWLCFY